MDATTATATANLLRALGDHAGADAVMRDLAAATARVRREKRNAQARARRADERLARLSSDLSNAGL
ncbi:MAG: hypothetical protein ACO3JT_09910 [Candidatus Nanopelagicales bacterium]